jgi:uncharacterized membrane protein
MNTITNSNKQQEEIKSALEEQKTISDKLAISISNTFGTLYFLCTCAIFFTFWICWNLSLLPGLKPFDRYPFAGLEMIVSIFAIILSVSVLISQNRQGKMEKLRQQVEFEVNVRAENEITKVLHMLHEIQKKMGIDHHDSELETMKENIDLQQLHRRMGDPEPSKDS